MKSLHLLTRLTAVSATSAFLALSGCSNETNSNRTGPAEPDHASNFEIGKKIVKEQLLEHKNTPEALIDKNFSWATPEHPYPELTIVGTAPQTLLYQTIATVKDADGEDMRIETFNQTAYSDSKYEPQDNYYFTNNINTEANGSKNVSMKEQIARIINGEDIPQTFNTNITLDSGEKINVTISTELNIKESGLCALWRMKSYPTGPEASRIYSGYNNRDGITRNDIEPDSRKAGLEQFLHVTDNVYAIKHNQRTCIL